MYNITKLLSCSFPTENFVTFPSGPLGSSAQLLAQSHSSDTHTFSHTHCLYLSISLCLLFTHTHARAYMSNIQSARKNTPAYAKYLIERLRIFQSSYRSETLALYYGTQCHLHKTAHSYDQRDLPPLQAVYWPSGPHVRAQCLYSIQLSTAITLPAHSV